jgi:hypothetical protein
MLAGLALGPKVERGRSRPVFGVLPDDDQVLS